MIYPVIYGSRSSIRPNSIFYINNLIIYGLFYMDLQAKGV